MKLIHARSFEWNCTVKHGKQNNSCAPQVDAKAVSVLVFEDLGSNICRCSALLFHLGSRYTLLADTKVCNLDRTLAVKQDVIQLDVSVANMLRMNILETINNLFEYLFSIWLLESSSLSDIIKQITSCTELHDNNNVFLCLDGFINFNDVIMSELKKKIDLLH